jgi:multidrug efflux system membrane fusion protein
MPEWKSTVMSYLAVVALATASDLALVPTALSADGLQINKPAPARPVAASAVKRNDTPNFLTGIGHVQAYNTVVVRSQVEGQILRLDFKEGQAVHKGDLLAQVDPRPFQAKLDGLVANRTRDQAQLAIASEIVQRDLPALSEGLVSQQQVDNEKAQVAEFTAAVQSDQAAVENAQLQLGYTHLTAPIDGITGIRQIDIGNIIGPTDANGLVVIAQLQPISVIFTLPETDLAQIQRQMAEGSTTVFSYSQYDRANAVQGTLELIDNQIIQATDSVKLKATLPNPFNRLWPGELVSVRLLVNTRQSGLTIASPAVQQGPRLCSRAAGSSTSLPAP